MISCGLLYLLTAACSLPFMSAYIKQTFLKLPVYFYSSVNKCINEDLNNLNYKQTNKQTNRIVENPKMSECYHYTVCQTGEFGAFDKTSISMIYLATSEFPASLLPNQLHKFVCGKMSPPLLDIMATLAAAGKYY